MVQAFLEDGAIRTDFVPAGGIRDMARPTVAELNSTANLLLSDYLINTGWKLNHTQETVEDDRESYSAAGEIPGGEKFAGGSLEVVDNLNRGDCVDNKAVETLTKGTEGYIVRRRGAGHDPYKAGQKVSVFRVTIGIKTPVAHAKNARQLSTISFSVAPGAYDETATVTADTPGVQSED